jgi:hypothetical protein
MTRKKERWGPVILNGLRLPYLVSTNGRIKNNYGKVLKVKEHRGTKYINLVGTPHKQTPICSLVLESFDRGPNTGEYVNFSDGNPLNVTLDNLSWGEKSMLKSPPHAKRVVKVKGAKEEVFRSAAEAARKTGIDYQQITRLCRSGKKQNGISWRYL